MSLSIIVPVYNEHATLGKLLMHVLRVLPDVAKTLVIVDDCSTDGTRAWLKCDFPGDGGITSGLELPSGGNVALVSRKNRPNAVVRVHYHARNFGKGAGIRSGLAMCSGDVVVIQDADHEYDPTDLAVMCDLVARRQMVDVV